MCCKGLTYLSFQCDWYPLNKDQDCFTVFIMYQCRVFIELDERAANGAWDASAAGIHLQFVRESLSGVRSGLSSLIRITKSNPGVMIIQVCSITVSLFC